MSDTKLRLWEEMMTVVGDYALKRAGKILVKKVTGKSS
jgi:hypothetical protein